MSVDKKWVSAKILRKQMDEVKSLIQEDANYSSVNSFIREAIREKLERTFRLLIDRRKYPPFRHSEQVDQEDHSLDH